MARMLALAVLALPVAAALAGASPATAADVCTCRAPGGKRVELGGTACLPTPAGPRLARCIMDVNILSWQNLDTPCIVSFTPIPQAARRLAGLSPRAATATTP